MDLLPDEVLLMIFECLPVNDTTAICKRVCKRWAKLIERRSLIIQAYTDTTRLHNGLRSLLVLGWLASLRSILFCTAYYSPYLQSLTVQAGMPFTNEHLADLRHLVNLEHLDVFARSQVHDANFAPVVRRLKSVVFNENIAPDLLRDLASNCQLTEIHMYGRAVYYHRRHMRAVLTLRGEYIHSLTLRCTELTDTGYEMIGNCENLISLRLYSCWLLTRKGVMHVTRPLLLQCLHLTGTRLVRSHSLGEFIHKLPLSIKELVLSASWFGDEHVPILVKRLPALQTFEVWKCKLSAAGAVALALSLPALKTFDLDLLMSPSQMNELQTHTAIEMLRCLIEKHSNVSVDNSMSECRYIADKNASKFDKNVFGGKKMCVISSDAKYARKYFRSGSEGFRGSLFYFWTRSRELVPVPEGTRPTLDDEDDMFY